MKINTDQRKKNHLVFVKYTRLNTYFGNFIFGFSSLRLRDFLYYVFRLQGKMGKTKRKINKLLCNILVTSSPKTTKNELPKWDETLKSLLFPLKITCTGTGDSLAALLALTTHRSFFSVSQIDGPLAESTFRWLQSLVQPSSDLSAGLLSKVLR